VHGQVAPVSIRPCNRFHCPASVVVWAVGPWGPCSAPPTPVDSCEVSTGNQTRTVACVAADGSAVADSLCLAVAPYRPPASQPCVANSTCYCLSAWDCGDAHKACNTSSNTCVCGPGWGSQFCDVPVLLGAECAGVVDIRGSCCAGAVDAATGVCCSGAGVADKRGACCASGVVDACGECDGSGVAVDANGVCCAAALPPSGECCTTSVIDSCGVCGGDNACGCVALRGVVQGLGRRVCV